MPVFLNYRCYLKPQKTFSPHVNIAVGALIPDEKVGMYSAITMGFRAGKFSFSSGISLMAIPIKEDVYEPVYDQYGYIYTVQTKTEWKIYYPFGITLKWGFSF
jgi:hypothetical protein